ncbi:MAG: sulfatase [Blastocatellia bacterium]
MKRPAAGLILFLATMSLAMVWLGHGNAAQKQAAPRRPNVLFISVDDLNNDLGCYGHAMVKSPNIDRLAARGVRFDRAYCQFPLCSPSRSSMMTGLRPDALGVYDLRKHFRETLPDVVTMAQLFRRNEYFAARVGKIFHYGNPGQIGTDGLDDEPSWDQRVNPRGIDKDEESAVTNLTPGIGLGSAFAFYESPAPDEAHTDGIVASETIRLLEKNRDRPFFIAAGFYRPHTPYISPKKYFDLYPLEKISAARVTAEEMTNYPKPAVPRDPAKFGVDEMGQRRTIRAYYAAISFLDANVGRVLDALDRLGLAESTIVVFWSDHGYLLGQHGQWQKTTLFEGSARTPLIVAGPGVTAKGKASGRTVEALDLYPTLADLCGLRGAPPNLAGESLRPLLRNPRAGWNKPALTQQLRTIQGSAIMGYSLRDERYRYTEWDEGRAGRELYDYRNDPRESRNVAADPRYANIASRLKAQLSQQKRIR